MLKTRPILIVHKLFRSYEESGLSRIVGKAKCLLEIQEALVIRLGLLDFVYRWSLLVCLIYS